MKKVKIAFDIDGTIITLGDMIFSQKTGLRLVGEQKPNYPILNLLMDLSKLESIEIYIWSAGGIEYAQRWVERLGIEEYITGIIDKSKFHEMDICFDDNDVVLAKVNILVAS